MNLRKVLSIAAVGVMGTMLLAGCGGGSQQAAPAAAAPAAAAPAAAAPAKDEGNKSITLVLSQRDEWLSTLVDAAEAAAKDKGYVMNTADCQSDVSKAIQFVDNARTAGEKAIIINMVDMSQAPELIEHAGDMKVVFVNRCPEDPSVLTDNAIYVGSNEMTSGKFQGDALVKYFKDKGQTDVKYILLNGILGQTSTTNRTASVLGALKEGGINAVEASAPLACDYDRAKAIDKISPLLSAQVEFDCIISNNDAMALGAIEALKANNMDPSAKPIVGIDCTADGAAAVESGEIYMTVFQNAKGQGNGAMQAAINLLNGDPINKDTGYEIDSENPHIVWVPFEPVDKDNVANYK